MPTATAASARYDKRTVHYAATVHVSAVNGGPVVAVLAHPDLGK